MRKKLKLVACLFLLISLVACTLKMEAYAVSQTSVESQLTSYINQYAGKTATSEQMMDGKQCKGFANWVFYNIFGVRIGAYIESANYKIGNPQAATVGIIEPGSLTESSAKELLQKGKPGDYIQVQRSIAKSGGKCGPHSMILVGVKADGVQVFDCNSDGKNTIKTYLYTWSKFDYDNRAMSLYHAHGYEASVNTSIESLSCYTAGNQVYFNWKADGRASSYNLKIWKNKINDGSIYKAGWGIKGTDYSLVLPSGTYQAYVDGINTGYCQMSNIIEFTVSEGNPKLNVNLTGNQAYFNWTRDARADRYNLRVYKGAVWESDPYEVLSDLSDTNAAMALPSGTYQAYVDAYGGDYLHMGNVIEFTVQDAAPVLSVNVTGNQTYFSWTKDNKATEYELKIYRGKVWNSPVYEVMSGVKTTDFLTAMPPGTYQAYVDAVNGDGYRHMGSVAEFTVGNASPKLEASVNGNRVTFHWTEDPKADSYRLRVYTGHVWTSDIYKAVTCNGKTTETLTIPSGTYQAYIDATGNDYLQVGSVVEFTVSTESISECTVEMKDLNYTYDGLAKTPSIVVKKGDVLLTAGTDYTVSYSDNINAGTAAAVITGKGNYTGTIRKIFTINKAKQNFTASISDSSIKEGKSTQITLSGQGTWSYTSSNSKVASVDASGKVTGKAAGTAVITVTAGETANYTSVSKNLSVTVTHNYNNGVITKTPTCIEDGIRTYICSECKKSYTEAVKAAGHKYKEKITAATCTEAGYTTHICSVCNDSYRDKYKNMLGHNFDEGTVTEAATGDTNGIKTYTCSRCKAVKEEIIPATEHVYDDGVVTKAATCTETGIMTYRCRDCDKTYTREIPASGHEYRTSVTEPTCVEKGYTTHTCTVCKNSYKDTYTDAVGHSYNCEVIEEATCTEGGIKHYSCTLCGNQYEENIAPEGHKYKEIVTAPTCTRKGYTTYACTVCKESYKGDFVDALAHDYDEGEIQEEATCTEKGKKVYTCRVCKNQYTEIIAPFRHNYQMEEIEATCTEEGMKVYTCLTCKDQYVETTAALGHDYQEITIAPTCEGKGYTEHSCVRCGAGHVDNYVEARGHRWDEGKITVAPTQSSTGIRMYHCKECGKEKTETIPVKLPEDQENLPTEEESDSGPVEENDDDNLLPKTERDVCIGGSRYRMVENLAQASYVGPENQKVTSVTIPDTVVINGVRCKVTSIEKNAFKNNKFLTKVKIGNNIKVIHSNAFNGCKKLKSVTLGKNVTIIQERAFYKCTALAKFTIPSKVEVIGRQAFYGCKKLKNITIKTVKLTSKNLGSKAFQGIYKKASIKVPKKKLSAYKKMLRSKGVSTKAKIKK